MTFTRRSWLSAATAAVTSAALPARSALAAVMPAADPQSLGFDAERLKRIPVALQRRVDAGEAPGFVAAVVRDGKVARVDTVGFRDIANKTPMARDTIFRIMSMTKPIVSVAAMMLVEENKLRLTDPVGKFIPAFAKSKLYVSGEGANIVTAPAKRRIQIRNLLSHTSGYSYGVFNNSPIDKLQLQRGVFTQNFKSLADFCAAAADLPLMFEPGTAWQYGISTDILGHVIEVVSGQSLPDFLSQRIFAPLDMADTAFFVAPEKAARLANVYEPSGNGLAIADAAATSKFLTPPPAPSGGGGLTSTADDYLSFATMLLNEGQLNGVRLLGPQTVQLMRVNHLPDGERASGGAGFGLGFAVDETVGSRSYYGGPGTFYWSGANRTYFWIDPTTRIVGLSMTQMEPFNNSFEEDMRALVYQAYLG